MSGAIRQTAFVIAIDVGPDEPQSMSWEFRREGAAWHGTLVLNSIGGPDKSWDGSPVLHAFALQEDLDNIVARLDALIHGEDGPFVVQIVLVIPVAMVS
jgi:hypothetical protein